MKATLPSYSRVVTLHLCRPVIYQQVLLEMTPHAQRPAPLGLMVKGKEIGSQMLVFGQESTRNNWKNISGSQLVLYVAACRICQVLQ